MLDHLISNLAWFDARGTDGMDERTAQVFTASRAVLARSIEAHTGRPTPAPRNCGVLGHNLRVGW